ncbi:MAG TPA: carboxynorspermidine decarboxylase [Campylobacterales bacterium]|nr:carboxynorspermidine decarboxylase [Campylobacterales bacterium]HIO71022.1 carboxynorspermidine decarboxylase [Campylobacterales bacterium]
MEYIDKVPTPSYVMEEKLLKRNLQLLKFISDSSNLKILMALKGFALWKSFPLVRQYLIGTSASGLHEAKLGYEEFGGEIHTYSPAFNPDEVEEIAKISNVIVFNSFTQLDRYFNLVKSINPNISIGIRLNPQYSSTKVELYNPCAPYSRLGIVKSEFDKHIDQYIEKIDGFHIHGLCEQGVEDLEPLYQAFETQFGDYFKYLKWINLGGGHLITRKDYDIGRLIQFVKNFYSKYPEIDLYIEPSEAIGWETGYLVAEVLDIVHNGMDIAILNTSAETHMPDVLAMPYRPNVVGEVENGKYLYRFGGNSCLAGDIIGDYKFDNPLKVGDRVVFKDMIHYTMVKNTTFNGLPLPSIVIVKENGEIEVIKKFGYLDYKNRLS